MELADLLSLADGFVAHYNLPDLSIEEWMKIMEISEVKALKKNEYFTKAGLTTFKIAFILEGSFRYFYIKEDNEKTAYFVFKNGILASLESITENKPGTQSIQALEDSLLFVIDYLKMKDLFAEHHKFEHLGRAIGEHYIMMLHNQLSSFLVDTPEERYIKLVETQPDLLNSVPLQYIASFIGVTPVSLSRIRKRIYKK